MEPWVNPEQRLPDEKELVWVRVRGDVRPRYYRMGDRWYALVDLERWRMKESPYWSRDRSWYVKTEDIEGWRAFNGTSD